MRVSRLLKAICFVIVILLFTAPGVGAGTVLYSYDDAGRLIKADMGTQSIHYTYDSAGNLLKREVKDEAKAVSEFSSQTDHSPDEADESDGVSTGTDNN